MLVSAVIGLSQCASEPAPGSIDEHRAPRGAARASPVDLTGFVVLTKWLPGLQQQVQLLRPKGHSLSGEKMALLEDGRMLPLRELWELEHAAYRARYSSRSAALDAQLRVAPPSERLSVTFHLFHEIPDSARVRHQIVAGSVRATPSAPLRERIGEVQARGRAALERRGLTGLKPMAYYPGLYGEVSAAELVALGVVPEVSLITSNAGSRGVPHGPPTNAVSDARIDTAFNAFGNYGAGTSVGIVEQPDCRLYDVHESFTYNPLHFGMHALYDEAGWPIPCSSPLNCRACNYGEPGPCMNLGRGYECVAQHASWVAGVVTATRGPDRWGAAEATVAFANRGELNTVTNRNQVACFPPGLSRAYSFLFDNMILMANESWGCDEAGDEQLDGYLQDWYARYFDILPVKAGGNFPVGWPYTICTAEYCLQACPLSSNSLCVGGSISTGGWWPGALYYNPTGSDREEPDVTALAENVETLNLTSPTASLMANGTSGAAPAVAAMLAMSSTQCPLLTWTTAAGWRAVARQAAYKRNPDGYRYSTPLAWLDQKDGAGGLTADALKVICNGPGPAPDEPLSEYRHLAIYKPLTPDLPPWVDYVDPPGPPPEALSLAGAARPAHGPSLLATRAPTQTPAWGRRGSTRKGEHIESMWLEPGQRLRVTLTWDSCSDGSGPAPAPLATDLDLMLMRDGYIPVYSSQSFDDNAEGFDITIQAAGTYDLWYGMTDLGACAGDTSEEGHIIWSWWQP